MAQKAKASTTDKLVDELLSQVDPKEMLKKDGLFAQLKKQLIERALNVRRGCKLTHRCR